VYVIEVVLAFVSRDVDVDIDVDGRLLRRASSRRT
jgi:hypothetical protein